MRNLNRGGLRCSLFYTHAWNEGAFEFICDALATRPDEGEGAQSVLRRAGPSCKCRRLREDAFLDASTANGVERAEERILSH